MQVDTSLRRRAGDGEMDANKKFKKPFKTRLLTPPPAPKELY